MTRQSQPDARADDPWEKIQRSPLADAYLSELYWLARDTVEICERIFSAAPPPADTQSSYIKADHRLHGDIYRALNNAARIRALVKKRPRAKSRSAAQYAIQEKRTRWLSQELSGLSTSEIFHANVRNTLEHFDEYLDETALKFSRTRIKTRTLLPMDMTVGREGTLEQFAAGGSVYPLRIYEADERVFVNCGKRISLDKIAQECQAIAERMSIQAPWLIQEGDVSSQERGSSMIVLTAQSFDPGSGAN